MDKDGLKFRLVHSNSEPLLLEGCSTAIERIKDALTSYIQSQRLLDTVSKSFFGMSRQRGYAI